MNGYAGSYHLYTHDNLTNSVNFTISNQTIGFDFNGPNILSETEQAINATNHGLIVTTVSQPGPLIPGQNATWLLNVQFRNGTYLSSGEISNASYQFLATNGTGVFLPETINHTVENGYLRITFRPTISNGSMTFAMKISYSNNSGSFSDLISITPIKSSSVGLSLYITPIQKVQANVSTIFTLDLTLHRGNASYSLTQTETQAVLNNLSVDMVKNGNFMGLASAFLVSPGTIGITVNATSTGQDWELTASSHANISGNVHGSTITTFSVVSYNPTQQQPTTGQQIIAFLESPDGIITLATSIGIPFFYGLISWSRKKERTRKDEQNSVGLIIEGLGLYNGLTKEESQALVQSIPVKDKNEIMARLTSGRLKKMVLKNAGKPPKKKDKILEEIRNEL